MQGEVETHGHDEVLLLQGVLEWLPWEFTWMFRKGLSHNTTGAYGGFPTTQLDPDDDKRGVAPLSDDRRRVERRMPGPMATETL